MGNIIAQVLYVIGSLGLFLYGMKLMSESLQRIAGNKLRDILGAVTSNTFKCVLVGTFVTAVIQSSSATTVMIISFVNAGLLQLSQAIGMIMGANIGTTATAWLISLGAFEIDLGSLAIPIMALALPLLFVKKSQLRSTGEFIVGFTLLFLGLGLLKESMAGMQDDPSVLGFLARFSDLGFWSILLFVLVGTVLTIVIQSSSATMALTIIMCNNGWIPFECACAMVLGENIGTTVTANVAATVANTDAQRAARAHMIFNLIGVFWVLAVFPWFVKLITGVVDLFGGNSPVTDPAARPVALALFHTLFNVINTLLLVWFVPQITAVVSRMVRPEAPTGASLAHIERGMLTTSGITIMQAYNELSEYSKRSSRMFGFVRNLFKETNQAEFDRMYERIERYERISDSYELDIYTYLTKTLQTESSIQVAQEAQVMFKVISDIERMSDGSYRLARMIKYKRDNKIWFDQDLRDRVNEMFALIDKSIQVMTTILAKDYPDIRSLEEVYAVEEQINRLERELRDHYLFRLEDTEMKNSAIVIFSEIISESERLGDAVRKISEDILNIAPHSKPLPAHE